MYFPWTNRNIELLISLSPERGSVQTEFVNFPQFLVEILKTSCFEVIIVQRNNPMKTEIEIVSCLLYNCQMKWQKTKQKQKQNYFPTQIQPNILDHFSTCRYFPIS